MRSQTFLAAVMAIWAAAPASAQTYTNCNPLTSTNCPADTALGKSVNIDFTSGESSSFTPQGSPTYDSNGASFTVAKAGDSPLIASKWYIMFGHVEFVVKAAPGVGIVSSAILQSDDLDEIDFEWLGYDDANVQTNYFGKGETTTYNRGQANAAASNHDDFITYAIDWTADQITWQVNGATVRTLTPDSTGGYPYPQTPMMIKVGSWSGGDASAALGTRQWATGQASGTVYTDYTSGPYSMVLKSIAATDYSTGSQYEYSGTDGTWQSITAVNGKVVSTGNGDTAINADVAPSTTGTTNGPMPFQGTHAESSSSVIQPNAGGWTPTTLSSSSTATVTTYPGLPAGWTVTSSGKVLPPSAASVTSPQVSSTSLPADSQQGSPGDGGYEVVTSYNQQGFPMIITQPAGAATAVKSYNEQGFLITDSPSFTTRASPTALADSAVSSPVVSAAASASQKVTKLVSASAKAGAWKAADLVILFAGWLLATSLML
ncbi:hypothetical protein HO173_008773 [Letharia columbiana]|uniref:Crh-like protein n=1 Tax=Letharia columbiana TaxID=112416 RepID=A0A8H6FQU8_9LECA|nr:uncharacterized protein HO173_008773 [Letharia columbiana]KAF6233017.1 hypothetical protein HO173_008773 [Letharia columbiana]